MMITSLHACLVFACCVLILASDAGTPIGKDTSALKHTEARIYDESFSRFRINLFMFQFGGEWRPVFRMFMHFINYHPEITITVLTDLPNFEPYDDFVPPNVHHHPVTLEGLANFTNTLLNTTGLTERVAVGRPYKVCDYRIIFGKMFHELLVHGNYTHWGWIDQDVLFGTLFTPHMFPARAYKDPAEHYMQFDTIGINQAYFANGPFTLLRFNDLMTELYSNVSYFYLSLHTYPNKPSGVDEINFHHTIKLQHSLGNLRLYQPPLSGLECGDSWIWYNGTMVHLARGGLEECVYAHFGGANGKRMRALGQPFLDQYEELMRRDFGSRHDVGIMQQHAGGFTAHYLFQLVIGSGTGPGPRYEVAFLTNTTNTAAGQRFHPSLTKSLDSMVEDYLRYLNSR
jgi:hypothetical protein